jgi:hypothetical protein
MPLKNGVKLKNPEVISSGLSVNQMVGKSWCGGYNGSPLYPFRELNNSPLADALWSIRAL